MPEVIYTLGYEKRSIEEFVVLANAAGLEVLIDVRAARIIEKAPQQPMPPVRRAAQSSAYRVRFHCTVTEREFGRFDTS